MLSMIPNLDQIRMPFFGRGCGETGKKIFWRQNFWPSDNLPQDKNPQLLFHKMNIKYSIRLQDMLFANSLKPSTTFQVP
jgi:hypothetical protein